MHEMNTINHYVGMYPIETGAPVERPLAKFFFGFFAVMLLAFTLRSKKLQLAVLGVPASPPWRPGWSAISMSSARWSPSSRITWCRRQASSTNRSASPTGARC
ncbi:MAG: hypothetical protein MZW92_42890 [Comamonadaceae bacterium]|nr:hypothetical protein [Comamonadaceae bacterium]